MGKNNPLDLSERKGFDAPVYKKEDDKLGRWQFANDIYSLAISCPKNWSVRIGIYGDWGAGKSSILSFIRTMAEADGQILIEFNPWGFDDKERLWREFVYSVYKQLGAYKPPHMKRVLFKSKVGQYAKIAASILKAGNKVTKIAGQATEEGLELVKKYLSNNASDLIQLPGLIGDKKIIVLIDDLDRADPALVPGVLYALRELVDIPGFSFILAFDPRVISKIMKKYNEGISNGLKFLEKIIDYPRWLPDIKLEQKIELARSDIDRYCAFVDKKAFDQVKDLLPDNPRSIRLFIRNISLLEKHVNRYYENELNWAVLLLANLLKTKVPEYSYKFFSNVTYWEYLEIQRITEEKSEEAENKFKAKIRETAKTIGCSDAESSIIETISLRIGSLYGLLTGDNIHKLTLLAEEPPAVTIKEFDDLLARCKRGDGRFDIGQWMERHGESHNFEAQHVYADLFEVAVSRRINALSEAADAIEIDRMKVPLEEADTILEMLSSITLEYGKLNEPSTRFSASQFKLVTDMINSYFHFDNTDKYKEQRLAERMYLLNIVKAWTTGTKDIMRLLKIGPHYEAFPEHSGAYKKLIEEIGQIVIPRFIEEILANLKEPEHLIWMLKGDDSFSIKWFLCDPDAELWKTKREAMLELMAMSINTSPVYENLFNLMLYYDHVWRGGHDSIFRAKVTKLLSDKEILESLWTAITCKRPNPRAVGSFKGFPEKVKKDFGTELEVPKWWPLVGGEANGVTTPQDTLKE
jgi:hypothetical protein